MSPARGDLGLDRGALEAMLSRALAFLERSQLPYGEFSTYGSPDPAMAADCRFDSSPFVTALVLYALGFVREPRAQTMIARGLDFLLSEMEGPGLWRYWTSRNPQHEALQPDLDVITCVSAVLRQNGRPFPDNTELVQACRNEAGLFYTYVTPRPGTPPELRSALGKGISAESLFKLLAAGMLHEVDGVVNLNVLFYLGETGATRAVAEYGVEIVARNEEARCSRYYRDALAFDYMFSRAYFAGAASLGRARAAVLEKLAMAGEALLETPLRAALAGCTQLNFGCPAPTAEILAYLQSAQQADGSWPRSSFYFGPAPYYGSEELTTAFCIETLARTLAL